MGRQEEDMELTQRVDAITSMVRVGFLHGQDAGAHGPAFHKVWWPSKAQIGALYGCETVADFERLTRPVLPADLRQVPARVVRAWHASLRKIIPAQITAWFRDWDEDFSDPEGMSGPAGPSAA